MTIQNGHLEPVSAPAELWRHPNPTTTEMWRFLEHVNSKYGLQISDYPGLYRWSIDNVASFWEEVWHFTGVKSSQPFGEVGAFALPSAQPPFT
jgi:acetoacetyl-CoA synthetase